jgi:hypothetical protein
MVMPRPRLLEDRPLTAAERQQRRRDRLAGRLPPWVPKAKPSRPEWPDAFLEGLHDVDELFEKGPGAGTF